MADPADAAEPVSILLVDDRPEKLAVLAAALDAPDLRLVTAGSGTDALRLLLQADVAVILLDVDMPGMDGYETARLIRGRERSRHTPIIFITAYASDETPVAKGYALGAVDYLFAPVSPAVLRAKVAAFVELHRLRAQAQSRAESSETRWAALAEAVPQLVWSTDAAGRMVFANRRWLEYTGIPFERSQELGFADVVHPEDLAGVMAAWGAAVADRTAFEIEFRLRRGGDGAWRWFLCRGVPRHDRSGRLEGWVGTSTDVHQVRETERRLRWLLDNTSETIWRFDGDGPMPIDASEDAQLDAFYANAFLAECNAAMARVYGFASPEEMKGLRLPQMMPREDPANDAMLRAFIRGGYRLIDAESSERAKDGSERWFLNNLIGEVEGGMLVRAWGTSRDITERKLRERELAESERRFRAVANVVPVLIWEADRERRRTWFNTRWLEFTGRPLEQQVGDGWIEDVHPDDRERYLRAYADGYAARRIFTVEYRLRRADGRWRRISATGAPRFAPDTTFLGYVGACIDIHDQREAESALAARERQLTLITDQLPALICYVDADERFRFVNRTYCSSYGVTAGDLIGRRFDETLPAGTVATIAGNLRAALAGKAQSYEAELAYPALGSRWMHIDYIPDRGADGVVYGVVVLVQDFSGRRREEERTRLLGDASPALASSLDAETALPALASLLVPRFADGCLIDLIERDGVLRRVLLRHVDPAVERAADVSLRRMSPGGRDGSLIIEGGLAPRRLDLDVAASAASPEERAQLATLRALGCLHCLVAPMIARGRPVGVLTLVQTRAGGRSFDDGDVAFAEELARRAAIALDNARLYQDAERQRMLAAQRADQLAASNAELEQFAYVSSHDLQEPLRMVTQYMGLLQRRYADRLDDRGRSFVAYAAEGAMRMHRLIDDLLAYARTGRADQPFAPVELAPLVAEVLANLRAQIEDAQAEVQVGELPAVRGDRTRLALVLQNLIGNALKFSDRPARVRIAAERLGRVVELAVSDRGIGIEPQHQARIFEVFQRLHSRERYPGTGIGLAICKKIVEQHGGRIWVESQAGAGSTFRFTLPAADAGSATGQHPALR